MPSHQHITPFASLYSTEHFTHLRLSLDHVRAGVSVFTGQRHTAGHVLRLVPERRSPGSCVSILLGKPWESGFYLRLDDAGRRNPHALKRYAVQLAPVAPDLAAAFAANDGDAITTLVRGLAAAAPAPKRAPAPTLPAPAPTPATIPASPTPSL